MILRSRGGIAYEERGSGASFVALHGYSLDRRMSIGAFEPLFEAIEAETGPAGHRYRRIYPDLPFMGESADAFEGQGHDGMLDAIRGFIEEVAPTGPLLLAGESYGGYLARGLVRAFGDRAKGIFLLCPMIVGPADERDLPPAGAVREEALWRESAKAEGASADDLLSYEGLAATKSLRCFRRFRDEVLVGIRIARLDALAGRLGGSQAFAFDRMGSRRSGGRSGGRSVADPAEGAFDAAFDRPACFFLGRQDSAVGWRDAVRLDGRYPRASYFIVDGAGHNAQIEAPEAFAAAFKGWLAECVRVLDSKA
jgi:pimeloyl-ACP methyl ester carboxylesterase